MPGLEALLKGRELAGRYRIEDVIGRGGMGAVYRGTDLRLGRPVAVKVITVSSGNDPELRERLRARFRHEAASAAKLPHHPNVVPVYDYGTDPDLGLDYIVMELLRGDDLSTRLQRADAPPLAEALRILQHAARGVAVGHRSGLIHRDVKPGNIFLVQGQHADDELQVRVLDFGIAKAVADEDTASALTQDGRAPHSPAFASPEQLRNEPRLTAASDVFSLGAVGFQLLTRERPFTDADRNRMAAGLEVPTPSLRSRNPNIPPDVEAVIRRALLPDPAQRFAHAGHMADALEVPLRRLGETPAVPTGAAVGIVPVDGDRTMLDGDRTMLDGGDRTMMDDGDRTMLAPPVPPRSVAPPAPADVPRQPVMVPPRRRQAEVAPRRGLHPAVWVLLLMVIGGVAMFAFLQSRGGGGDGPVAGDSLATDTTAADSLDPADALVLSIEARRRLDARQYDSALVYAERAMAVNPNEVAYRDQAAVALLRLGRYDESARLLEDAIRMDRRYDLAYSHLAEARLAMGDTLNAVKALEGFVELTQNARDRARALQQLDALRQPPAPLEPPPAPTDSSPSIPLPGGPEDTVPARGPRDTIHFGTPP